MSLRGNDPRPAASLGLPRLGASFDMAWMEIQAGCGSWRDCLFTTAPYLMSFPYPEGINFGENPFGCCKINVRMDSRRSLCPRGTGMTVGLFRVNPLAPRFIQTNARRHRHIQTLDATKHWDAYDTIAQLSRQAPQTLTLPAHHET